MTALNTEGCSLGRRKWFHIKIRKCGVKWRADVYYIRRTEIHRESTKQLDHFKFLWSWENGIQIIERFSRPYHAASEFNKCLSGDWPNFPVKIVNPLFGLCGPLGLCPILRLQRRRSHGQSVNDSTWQDPNKAASRCHFWYIRFGKCRQSSQLSVSISGIRS